MFEDLTIWTRALTAATATLRHAAHTRLRGRPGTHRPGGSVPEDGGYTTETIVITALLVAAAISVVGILVARLTQRANSIQL